MKVYQVVKSYYDGDHDHGSYRSPLFARREDAEAFLEEVDPTDEGRYDDECHTERGTRWWSCSGGFAPQTKPRIVEHEIVEDWDGKVPTAKEARSITYT